MKLLLRGLQIVLLTIAVAGLGFAYPLYVHGLAWFDVTWGNPWSLALLALVPVVLWHTTVGEDSRTPRLRLGRTSPLALGPIGVRAHLRYLPGAIRAVAITLIALSLAQPRSLLSPQSSDEHGIDIVVVLDLSLSMKAVMDGTAQQQPGTLLGQKKRPTRLETAKAVIRDFVARRTTDRIGVVVFGTAAYVLAPLTLDYHLVDTLVGKMELDVVNGEGTAIGDAVGVAAARLRQSVAKSKAVVLLTDGDSNAGKFSPEYATELAQKVGCRVYTIQIGTGDMVDVEVGADLYGNPVYKQARFPVNPELLQKMAQATGGQHYVATDGNALSESMHDVLNRLEKSKFEGTSATYDDLFGVFLLPAALLVALEALLRSWLLRRFP